MTVAANILPFTARGTRPLLRAAQQRRQLVRVWREDIEQGSFCGYVGAIGREFVLLWVLGEHLDCDGIYALRLRDISEVEAPDQHHEFLEKALKVQHIEPRLPATFALDDALGVVTSAARLSGLLGVHVDADEESDICYIGRLIASDADGFELQEISPDGEWLTEPSFFAWDEVSTVSYNDPYAITLARVAGLPPPLKHDDGDSGYRSHP